MKLIHFKDIKVVKYLAASMISSTETQGLSKWTKPNVCARPISYSYNMKWVKTSYIHICSFIQLNKKKQYLYS